MKKSKHIWVTAISIIAVVLIINLIPSISTSAKDFTTNFANIISGAIAIIFLIRAFNVFKDFDQIKTAWLLFIIGMILNVIAEVIYAIYVSIIILPSEETFPTIADFFWCAAYIPLFFGISTLLISYRKSGFPQGKGIVIALIIITFISAITWFTYQIGYPIIIDKKIELYAKTFFIFYPIADFMLLLPAVLLLYTTHLFGIDSISKPLKYLTLGFAFITLADLAFSYLKWQDQYEGYGKLIDIAWNLGYFSIALAAFYHKKLIITIK